MLRVLLLVADTTDGSQETHSQSGSDSSSVNNNSFLGCIMALIKQTAMYNCNMNNLSMMSDHVRPGSDFLRGV